MSTFKKIPNNINKTATVYLQIIAKDEYSTWFAGFDWEDNQFALLFENSLFDDNDKRGAGAIFITNELINYYNERSKGILSNKSNNPLKTFATEVIDLAQGHYTEVKIRDPQNLLSAPWLETLMKDVIDFMRQAMKAGLN